MVHELIEAKCKVNVRTRDGMGALHLAAYKGYSEIAQELLDAGVAPDMQDKVSLICMCTTNLSVLQWEILTSFNTVIQLICKYY